MHRRSLLAVSTLLVGISGAALAASPASTPPPGPPAVAPSASAAVAAPAAALSVPSISYAVLLAGNPAGSLRTSVLADGRLRFDYELNDRGRGPQLTETIVLGADGLPSAIAISGHDYLKNPVDESFGVEAGRARWHSANEQGERAAGPPAFYCSFNATPAETGLLAAALLRRPDHRLTLLPEGEAAIEWIGERSVEGTETQVQVAQYAITGLDFAPTAVWLDDEGRLFAMLSAWTSVIREGFAGAAPELLAAQEAGAAARWHQIALAARREPAHHRLAITGARLFDPLTLAATPASTVVVEGERITAVGRDGAVAIPPDAERLDAAGRTLLPGLWDMHVHLGPADGALDLAAGITSVRDLANDVDELTALKKAWDSGEAVGPRIVRGGFMDGPGPYAGPSKVLVATADEARAWVDRYKALGYDQIKIYSSLDPKLVPGIIARAHEDGLRISGHVPAFMTADQLVRLGIDEIQHVNFLFLSFFADLVADTRTPARFTALAEHAAELDLGSPKVKSFLALLRERHVVVDPTVTVFLSMLTDRPGQISPQYEAVAGRLPAQVRRGILAGGLPVPAGKDELYRRSAAQLLKMVKALFDAGVTIVAGTDGLAGFTLPRELENYVAAGLPAPQVLAIATLGAARVARRDAELGTVAPGKLADLVLVDGAPDQRITDLRRVHLVVKGGAIYDPAALDRALGVKP